MYSAQFEYHAPATITEALALLDQYGDEAKVIAGSMSLVPLMKFRLTTPSHLIDLHKISGMCGVTQSGDTLQIGAMTTHRMMETNELVRAKLPMMAEAAAQIGDPQVRNMGTIGGSLSHADPSADWPAVTLALGATLQVVSKKGERTINIEQFILGPLTTALEPGEIISQVRVPITAQNKGSAYAKHPHPASRFALVGVAAAVTLDGNNIKSARIAVTGIGPKVFRATALENALQGKSAGADAIKASAALVSDGVELREDLQGSPIYQAHMAAVYAERALGKAVERARAGR